MTFGSLMGWGGFSTTQTPIERYHSGSGGYWDHKSHGYGHKSSGKGGLSGAALSALTLLAFMFLINVMQQSLRDNNSTLENGLGTTAVLLREDQNPASRNEPEKNDDRVKNDRNVLASFSSSVTLKKPKKGDTL